ncbi:MAG TPA: hypothetical protein VHD63_24075 [Ktedonobacteraceae bacterium]|jgi:hypothetical protein|nr:hypothetical protein [Ktedonobacteraceae bacterium]
MDEESLPIPLSVRASTTSHDTSADADAFRRINEWLDRLEEQARRLLDTFQPEDLEPAQAASVASKYITLIARLLELRQQFATETSSDEDRLLRLLFGEPG